MIGGGAEQHRVPRAAVDGIALLSSVRGSKEIGLERDSDGTLHQGRIVADQDVMVLERLRLARADGVYSESLFEISPEVAHCERELVCFSPQHVNGVDGIARVRLRAVFAPDYLSGGGDYLVERSPGCSHGSSSLSSFSRLLGGSGGPVNRCVNESGSARS